MPCVYINIYNLQLHKYPFQRIYREDIYKGILGTGEILSFNKKIFTSNIYVKAPAFSTIYIKVFVTNEISPTPTDNSSTACINTNYW